MLFEIPQNLDPGEEFKVALGSVYTSAEKLLQSPKHFHYTDHSIEHSKRILEIISLLLESKRILENNKTIELNNEERYVLVAAVLLHDIGMQDTPYSENFPDENDLEEIRKNHHKYSERLIVDSIKDGSYDLGLKGKREFVQDIAKVAAYHREFDLTTLKDDLVGNEIIRLKLLGSLIRLGDCLDLNYKRVRNIETLKINRIPVASEFFWFCHYYVRGMKIEKGKITIHFCFPNEYKERNSLLQKIICSLVDEVVKPQITEVYNILYDYGIVLCNDILIIKDFQTTVMCLPKELEDYIEKHIFVNISPYNFSPNIWTREELINAYAETLNYTKSYRNITGGPILLSPEWYKRRVMKDKKHKDYDSMFFNWVLEHTSQGVTDGVKLIFANTERYEKKMKEYLNHSEYGSFREGVIENIHRLWGDNFEKGPRLCCVNPGYTSIMTVSDTCAIITNRTMNLNPTTNGYFTKNPVEISNLSNYFDQLFKENYTSQEEEIEKLIKFVNQAIEDKKRNK